MCQCSVRKYVIRVWQIIYKSKFTFFILNLVSSCVWVDAAIDGVGIDSTLTRGWNIGEISMPQMLVLCLILLQLVVLYAARVIPVEVELGFGGPTGFRYWGSPRSIIKEENHLPLNEFILDCTLQFVCDVDTWANRSDHENFVENMLASWLKNPKSAFRNDKSDAFMGTGTCKEMYPCPFNVQEKVGIHIPGSQSNKIDDPDFIDNNLYSENFNNSSRVLM